MRLCRESRENRPVLKNYNEFAVDIGKKNIDNVTMDVLSMGMTGDYQVAIEEGATMVRVGTGYFWCPTIWCCPVIAA